MGVKEGEVYKESERKRVRDGERGTKKAGENEIDIQKERGLYLKKTFITLPSSPPGRTGMAYLHIASRSFLTSHLKTTLPTWIFFGKFPGH